MSDVEIPSGGEAEEISPEVGVADAEAEVQFDPEPEPPQYDFLEVDDTIRAKHVPVKVDGEDVPVPFEELVNSYSRESVSTQRFQEAAAIKQEAENALRLQQAMEINPQLTIQFLAQQAGVSVEEFMGLSPQQQQNAVNTAPEEDEYADPLERQLAEQQRTIQAMQDSMAQQAMDRDLMSAVGHLKSTYQIDDSAAREVVATAARMNAGLEQLPMIYESMAYRASQQATAQHSAAQAAEIQKRQAAVAKASQVISTEPSSAGTTSEVAPTFTSSREAITAALEGLGID